MIINKSSNVGIIRTAKNSNGGALDLTGAEITATFKESTNGSALFIKLNTTAGGGDNQIYTHSASNGVYEIKILAANTSGLSRRNVYCIITIVISGVTYSDQFWFKIRDNKGGSITTHATSGNTASRPTLTSAEVGFEYFDTDLSSPIWWNGTEWV